MKIEDKGIFFKMSWDEDEMRPELIFIDFLKEADKLGKSVKDCIIALENELLEGLEK